MGSKFLFHYVFSKFHLRYIWDGCIFNFAFGFNQAANAYEIGMNILGLELSVNPYVGWLRGFHNYKD